MPKSDGRESGTLILLYDGQCNLCLRSVETLRGLPMAADVKMVSLQEADLDEISPNRPLTRDQLLAQLHLVDPGSGDIYAGADAVVRVLRTVPQLAWIERIYRLPGLRPVAGFMYRQIARHRYRLFGRKEEDCTSGSCQIHGTGKKRDQGRDELQS